MKGIHSTFDCVEMKRKGAKILQKKLAGLTLEEELKFWQERNKVLKKDQLVAPQSGQGKCVPVISDTVNGITGQKNHRKR